MTSGTRYDSQRRCTIPDRRDDRRRTSFHNEPISPEASASSFESRRLDNPELKDFAEAGLRREVTPWPPVAWGLDLLAQAAYYYHPQMKVARATWEAAQAAVVTAGQYPNPALQLTPQYVTNAAGGVSPWLVDSSILFPIETAGKRGYRIARAAQLAAAARLNVATTAWHVRSQVRAGLLNLHAAMQTQSILLEQLGLREQIVAMLERQLSRGDISQVVLDQGRISQDQTQLSLIDTEEQVAQNRAALAQALGIPEAALDEIELSFDCVAEFPPRAPPSQIRRQALWTRPDLLASLADYEAAQSALQLEIARQYPDVSFGPAYQYDTGQNEWGIGVAVTLPILNRNRGPIAEAEAKRREAAARFSALQVTVIGDIERAVAGYTKAREVLRVADSILAQRTAQEKAAQNRFDAGDTSRLELLTAQLNRSAAALSRLQAFTAAPGTSLPESLRLGDLVSRELLKLPNAQYVSQKTGRAEEGSSTRSIGSSEIDLSFASATGVPVGYSPQQVREALAQFPGIDYEVNSFLKERIGETISGYAASVVVDVFSQDFSVLENTGQQVTDLLGRMPGAADVKMQAVPTSPEIVLATRTPDLMRWGFDPVTVLDVVRSAHQGDTVGQVYQGDQVFDVSVILGPQARQSVREIASLPLRSHRCQRIRLISWGTATPSKCGITRAV